MRRFITSLTGKVFSQLVIFALLLPSITLALLSRSEAQVAVLPRWAVVEFTNQKTPGSTLGKTASQAVYSELAKTGSVDLESDETVSRQIEALKISSPPTGQTNLLRLGEALGVSTLVTGNITDFRVLSVSGGKQARVLMSVSVYDVASGVAVNGSSSVGESTVRPSDAKDDELIEDAIQQGASKAIREIQSRNLPTATVLNTVTGAALINKGARSGFKLGQEVIIIRGRIQVAAARVSDVEPDSATIHVERGDSGGVQPGDKVRAVWSGAGMASTGSIDANGNPHTPHVRRSGSNSGVITVLLVLGLVAALLGGGNSNSQSATSSVTAEAMSSPDVSGIPAVKISWSPNGFAKGNSERFAWQIWRDDVIDGPVLVVSGLQTSAVDLSTDRTTGFSYLNTGGKVGGVTCDYGSGTNASVTTRTGVRAGHPYQYSVELVYALNSLDLPGTSTGGSSSGSSGLTNGTTNGSSTGTNGNTNTTGLTNGGGGTNGTTNGTTNGSTNGTTTGTTTGGQTCYFLSARAPASGLATPLNAPTLIDPAIGASVGESASFHFSTVSVGGFNLAVEYVVQISTSSTFPKGPQTADVAKTIKTGTGDVVLTVNTLKGTGITSAIRNASTLFYRVGARNVADKPGPVRDPSTGERYIFTQWRQILRTGTPPPPPRRNEDEN